MDPKLLFGLTGGGVLGLIGFVVGAMSWESVCSAIPGGPGSIFKYDLLLRSCPVVGDIGREGFGLLAGGILGGIGLINVVVSGLRRGATA